VGIKEEIPRKAVAENLLQFMDEPGIDMGVLLPIAPYVPYDYVYKIVSYEPKRLLGFASVVPNPADFAIKELRRAIEDLGLRGLKLHPGMQGFCILHPHVIKVIRFAGELGVPVAIHAVKGDLSILYFKSVKEHGLPVPDRIEDYDLLPVLVSGTTIAYAHMGGIVEEIGPQRFATYIKHPGAEKLLFGSEHIMGLTPDWLSARKQIMIIKNLPELTGEEKELILSKNAKKMLGIR